MRYKAVSCMSRSYRPMIPVSYIAQVLGFASTGEGNEEKESEGSGLEECVEWLKAHGACLTTDNNGEMQLDAKVSSISLLYVHIYICHILGSKFRLRCQALILNVNYT